jgi:flagellar protein FlbD
MPLGRIPHQGGIVITVHKLNGDEMVLNAELIEMVECTPDTLITLLDRRRFMVCESVDEIVSAVVDYRRSIMGVQITAPFAAAGSFD